VTTLPDARRPVVSAPAVGGDWLPPTPGKHGPCSPPSPSSRSPGSRPGSAPPPSNAPPAAPHPPPDVTSSSGSGGAWTGASRSRDRLRARRAARGRRWALGPLPLPQPQMAHWVMNRAKPARAAIHSGACQKTNHPATSQPRQRAPHLDLPADRRSPALASGHSWSKLRAHGTQRRRAGRYRAVWPPRRGEGRRPQGQERIRPRARGTSRGAREVVDGRDADAAVDAGRGDGVVARLMATCPAELML
jgi:hypothetical protein